MRQLQALVRAYGVKRSSQKINAAIDDLAGEGLLAAEQKGRYVVYKVIPNPRNHPDSENRESPGTTTANSHIQLDLEVVPDSGNHLESVVIPGSPPKGEPVRTTIAAPVDQKSIDPHDLPDPY